MVRMEILIVACAAVVMSPAVALATSEEAQPPPAAAPQSQSEQGSDLKKVRPTEKDATAARQAKGVTPTQQKVLADWHQLEQMQQRVP